MLINFPFLLPKNVSTTPENTGNLLEFEIHLENTGNILEFNCSSSLLSFKKPGALPAIQPTVSKHRRPLKYLLESYWKFCWLDL